MFQQDLLSATITLKHWAGRNSRGVTQFEGSVIHDLIFNPSSRIEVELAKRFLADVVDLAP